MLIIDTHSHVNFNTFKNDADEVIHRSLSDNTWMILVGSEYKTSKRALEYANKFEKGVFAAVGLHPTHVGGGDVKGDDYEFSAKEEEYNYDAYEKLANFQKVVAIGEIGLDYYHLPKEGIESYKKKQKEVFIKQLELALALSLPVIIHCRQAHDDMVGILTEFRKENKEKLTEDKPWGVMHCFSGDEDLAWKYFSLGLNISFTGLITFSKQWDDLIRKMPSDKFMVETDAPYMTPEPYRGKRNEPVLVSYVVKRIADIKNISYERVAEMSTNNARKLFAF
ncbi:hydrolase TatD [Candidatus Parcubacteria bacterium]|nr:MAG: hydrolase TatD [Candidatus Parcubacteria bacterium]